MTEVEVDQDFAFAGNVYREGDTVELPDAMADALAGSGHVTVPRSEGLEPTENDMVDQAVEEGRVNREGSGWYTILETGEKVQGKDAVREALEE